MSSNFITYKEVYIYTWSLHFHIYIWRSSNFSVERCKWMLDFFQLWITIIFRVNFLWGKAKMTKNFKRRKSGVKKKKSTGKKALEKQIHLFFFQPYYLEKCNEVKTCFWKQTRHGNKKGKCVNPLLTSFLILNSFPVN